MIPPAARRRPTGDLEDRNYSVSSSRTASTPAAVGRDRIAEVMSGLVGGSNGGKVIGYPSRPG